METVTKIQKKTDSTKKPTVKRNRVSDLSKIFGCAKGQIIYDDSVFKLGKRRV